MLQLRPGNSLSSALTLCCSVLIINEIGLARTSLTRTDRVIADRYQGGSIFVDVRNAEREREGRYLIT